MIKNPFCRPRLRSAARKSDGISPMSLIDRLREAVLRLIMISALSKGSNTPRRHRSSAEPPSSDQYYYPCPNDHHHTEAVADCIEFIKKSATTYDDHGHQSTAGAYVDAAVIPLPVM